MADDLETLRNSFKGAGAQHLITEDEGLVLSFTLCRELSDDDLKTLDKTLKDSGFNEVGGNGLFDEPLPKFHMYDTKIKTAEQAKDVIRNIEEKLGIELKQTTIENLDPQTNCNIPVAQNDGIRPVSPTGMGNKV